MLLFVVSRIKDIGTMIDLFVRFICMNFCITSLHHVFFKKKLIIDTNFIPLIIISIFNGFCFFFIPSDFCFVNVLLQLLLLFILFSYTTPSDKKTNLRFLILSYSISYMMYILASIIMSILYALISVHLCDIHLIASHTLQWIASILQCLMCHMLLQSKKLRNNLPFLHNQILIRLSIYIGLFIVIISMFESTISSEHSKTVTVLNVTYFLGIVMLLIFCMLLYIWWNTMSHQAYLLKAKERENERLTNELEFYKANLQEYQQEHEKLARLIHRDNKLIPSLQYSVQELLLQAEESEDIKLVGLAKELSSQLEDEKCSRKLEIEHLLQKPENFPATKIIGVDQYLLYFYHECHKRNIQFTCNLEADLSSIFSTRDDLMTVKEFCTLLSDLLENAKIAISYSNTSENYIHLFIGWTGEHLVMEISDSGIPFTKETLFHYGETKYTTHKKDGGSGIGIMETWKLLKKQQASLLIDESISLSKPFTKKIILTFDGCNRYELYPSPSRMETDLEYLSDRNDLKIRR